jgi:hypothetical protein
VMLGLVPDSEEFNSEVLRTCGGAKLGAQCKVCGGDSSLADSRGCVGIPSPSLAISDAVVTPLTGVLRQQVLYLSLSPSFTLFCVVLSPFGKILLS